MIDPIGKNFWEDKHLIKENLWLTGSDFNGILNFHKIDKKELFNQTVLEIGVGLGTFSSEVVKHSEKIICCDISQNALNNLNEKVKKKYLTENLKDIEPVDLAICHLVFQHCTNDEVQRIINDVQLKDTGVFSFQFAFIRENEKPNNLVSKYINNGSHHFRSFDKIQEMIYNSNKEIIWVSDKYDFYTPENFSWLIVKIKNKKK